MKGNEMKNHVTLRLGIGAMLWLLFVAGCGSSLAVQSGLNMRCPAWALYNPESKCDMALSTQLIGSSSVKVDMSEYDMTRMTVINYDVIVVDSKDIRIETDLGEKVVIEASRLLPGGYVIYNEIFNSSATTDEDTVDEVYLRIKNPNESSSTATLQFEFVRPARPTSIPTEESSQE